MKKLSFLFFLFLLSIQNFNAQNKPTAAVVNVHTVGDFISSETAQSLLRIELTKTEQFNVFDKLDLMEIVMAKDLVLNDCYGRTCLLNLGKAAEVDKIVSGAIEHLGKKIVITIKVLDVASGKYDKIAIQEFIDLGSEIQLMVKVTLNKALNIENDPAILDILVHYNQPPQSPTTYIKNSGLRTGIAYVGGETGSILRGNKEDGGFNSLPLLTQIGYQFEGVYLSAGNYQVLIEGIVMLTGLEQNMFSPNFTFINGFRNSINGWEIGFGPSFGFTKKANGYFDEDGQWQLKSVWNNDLDNDPEDVPNFVERMDSRGNVKLNTSWVWAVGKTFHSGYLNIPVNAYFSYNKEGWHSGLSFGFNITKTK